MPSSPGSTPRDLELQVEGRDLTLAGQRRPPVAEGARLPAARDRARPLPPRDPARRRRRRRRGANATYHDGILRVELPLVQPESRESHRADRARRGRRARDRPRRRPATREFEAGARGCPPRCRSCRCARRVPFPDTLMPLAVGQERSVQLVNDVLAGDRTLVMVAVAPARARDARPGGPLRRRRRRRRRAHDEACPTARCACSCRAASASASTRWTQRGALPRRRDRGAPRRRRRTDARAHGAHAQRAGDVHADRRAGPLPARGAADRRRQRRRPARAQPPHRRRRCACRPRRSRRSSRSSTSPRGCGARRGARARARGHLDRLAASRTQVQSELDKHPARVRPAPAAQGDPGGARRVRRVAPPRPTSCASGSPRSSCPTRCASRPTASSAGSRTCRRRPPSTASSAPTWSGSRRCRGTATTEDDLDLAHAREVLDDDHYEHRAGQGPHPRVPRRAQPQARTRRGSILCFVGPPGVGKTSLGRSIARALGREFERISAGGVRDEAEIRGHRRTYIGAMPGVDHPRAARRRLAQPAVHDRRDRQDGRGLPRRPVERDARGARPRAERDLPRPLPRPAVRPLGGDVHQRPPTTLDTIPRPLLDRMEVIELAGYTEDEKLQIAKRYLVPRQIERNGLKRSSCRSPTPRCARSSPTTRARPACASSSARSARSAARSRARWPRATAPQAGQRRAAARSRELLGRRQRPLRGQAAHARARRRDRPRLDAGRRRRALHRGDGDAGQRPAARSPASSATS